VNTWPTDRGSISVMTAILFSALLFVLALVVDGTDRLRALSRADAIATEAARAALSAVDMRGNAVAIDTRAAASAARDYLASAGYPGAVDATAAGEVHVTVALDEPARIGLLHSSYHVVGTATARLGVGTRESSNGGLP
jgi:Flp pilus assembly protein TadG